MNTKSNDFKIGLFVLIGLVLLVIGLVSFGGRDFFRESIRFETMVFGTVEGLNVGSVVKYRGVPVGKITRMEFAWNVYPNTQMKGVIVEFETQSDIVSNEGTVESCRKVVQEEIERGLRIRTQSQGITGVSFLVFEQLDPEENPSPTLDWTPRYCYIPSAPSQLGQIVSSIEETLRDLEKVDLETLGQTANRVLVSINDLLKNVNEVNFKRLGAQIEPLITGLRETNGKLQGLIETAQGEIGELRLAAVSQKAAALLSDLQSTNGKLALVLDNLSALEIQPINQVISSIRSASTKLNDVLSDLRDDPSVFIFGASPPPARGLDYRTGR